MRDFRFWQVSLFTYDSANCSESREDPRCAQNHTVEFRGLTGKKHGNIMQGFGESAGSFVIRNTGRVTKS